MEKLNNKRNFYTAANTIFTEYDFVTTILSLLYQNGIYKINGEELARKLYCYYKDSKYDELFIDIALIRDELDKRVDISDGLYKKAFFSRNVYCDLVDSSMLHLNYAIDKDISDHEQKLSEDGKKRIREIAEELSTQSIIEQQSDCPLYVYGFNPNKNYTLIHGKRSADLLSFELITDGDISSISYKKDDKNYYEDTSYPNRYVVLKDNDVANLKLKNASYSIKQGLCNDKICYSIVNTKITNLETLKQIMNIANNRYEDYNLTNKAPYVKKIVLK